MNMPQPNPSLWRERYESLRRHFLEDRQLLGADPLGLVLLLRRGLAGWIRLWTATPTNSERPASPAQLFESPPATRAQWQHQLTVVLAQMAARHLSPAPL
jgi:hypothetical protein